MRQHISGGDHVFRRVATYMQGQYVFVLVRDARKQAVCDADVLTPTGACGGGRCVTRDSIVAGESRHRRASDQG
jgi:hypothetical protein